MPASAFMLAEFVTSLRTPTPYAREKSSPQRRGIHRIVLEHRLLLRVLERVLEDVDLVWKSTSVRCSKRRDNV